MAPSTLHSPAPFSLFPATAAGLADSAMDDVDLARRSGAEEVFRRTSAEAAVHHRRRSWFNSPPRFHSNTTVRRTCDAALASVVEPVSSTLPFAATLSLVSLLTMSCAHLSLATPVVSSSFCLPRVWRMQIGKLQL
ncbi:hypothetical protein PIB30_099075 [Stylosanthes scabra]|uniref:Uncharacterized protein n=1 Tax=Stylosanthes scabra TaxID=79078 RepID=A0ABU6W0G6_9FABA|nr:hypothetical protein [Stylosanthes scabra]